MGCVRVSSALDSSRRLPETAREVFRELEVTSQHNENSQNR